MIYNLITHFKENNIIKHYISDSLKNTCINYLTTISANVNTKIYTLEELNKNILEDNYYMVYDDNKNIIIYQLKNIINTGYIYNSYHKEIIYNSIFIYSILNTDSDIKNKIFINKSYNNLCYLEELKKKLKIE